MRTYTEQLVSGAPPTAPVVSKTTGTVYEKALIERYIDENGTDPLSGEALTKEDLVDVKASKFGSIRLLICGAGRYDQGFDVAGYKKLAAMDAAGVY